MQRPEAGSHDPAPGAQEIAALEHTLYRAMIERDFQTLRSLLADDLWYVHSTGVAESKAEYLAALANGRYDYERIASRDVTIQVHGEIAVATGEVQMSVSAVGEPKALVQLLFTLLWVKQGGAMAAAAPAGDAKSVKDHENALSGHLRRAIHSSQPDMAHGPVAEPQGFRRGSS